MNKVFIIAGMEQHGLLLVEANLALGTAQWLLQQRLTLGLKYGAITWGDQPFT